MAYDANYWNSGQFMGNMPNEGPQINQPQVNDTDYGLLNAVQGPGLPEGMNYGEFQRPYSNEWYDEQGIVPADDDYLESIPEGTYDGGDNSRDRRFSFDSGAFGKGLMDLANQQSYDYKLF